VIPTIAASQGGLPRITKEVLCDLLQGKYDGRIGNIYVVDCRYQYEWKAGHIRGALHCPTPESARDEFMSDIDPNAVLIFHCELSCDRGPRMASMFREIDRQMNVRRYPQLFYPQAFILNGGFRDFFASYPEECEGDYRPMRAEENVRSGEMAAATRDWRRGLTRYEKWRRRPLEAMHEAFARMVKGGPQVVEEPP
jgi:M-phase inducer tyrosine phosphatase